MNIRIKKTPAYIRWQSRDVRDRYIREIFRADMVLEAVKLATDGQHFVINREPLEAALGRVARQDEMLAIRSAWERDSLKPRDNVLIPTACADILPDEPAEET